MDDDDRVAVVAASDAVLDVLHAVLINGSLDGYAQPPGVPKEIQELEKAFAERYGRNRTGIRFDLRDTESHAIFRRFAPWTIEGEAFSGDGPPLVSYHDGCLSDARLTDEEVSQLRRVLAEQGIRVTLVPWDEARAKWKSSKRERRRAILRRLFRLRS